MTRDRTTRLLEEFTAVTDAAPRPDSRRVTMRSRFPVATLSAASLIVVAVAVAAIIAGRPGPGSGVGALPPSSPAAVGPSAASTPVVASSVPAASQTAAGPTPVAPTPVVPTPIPTAPPAGATPTPTAVACDLAARIVSWEGAAGQRIATVELTNRAATDCLVEARPRPQLVDGAGNVLIDGEASPSGVIVLAAGGHASTLVAVGNWCKPEPPAPISVAFVFSGGGRLIADPVSPTDLTLPPCNGQTQPATISMHPWSAT